MCGCVLNGLAWMLSAVLLAESSELSADEKHMRATPKR
jgi:hypothetical protein